MKVIADFQLHSKYSRATSKNTTPENLAEGARQKGLQLLGTGDFTHPSWLAELKQKLDPVDGNLFKYKEIFFMLTGEFCTIYEEGGKTRKVHHMIHAPSFEVVEQVNEKISKYGNLKADARPILTVSSPQAVEDIMEISKDIMIYPAHCLLPNEIVITNPEIKEIQYVKEGDLVFTHTGKTQRIEKVLNRSYEGTVFKVIPWYFGTGIQVTPEHPFLAIKTIKNCNGGRGICKPLNAHIRNCYRHFYKNYKPIWIKAGDLEIGDVLLYPRIVKTVDIKEINLNKYIKILGKFPKRIKVDSNFCKLVGYYIAEGYTNHRDGIGFSFNKKGETKHIKEVRKIIEQIFNIKPKVGKTKGDLLFYSKNLMHLFEFLFYKGPEKGATNKCLPQWMLFLPKNKQVEIFKCWWRGDVGSTSSRLLHNQMKFICLRLGIVPCSRIDKKEEHQKRGRHFIGNRKIKATNDNYLLENLAFFEDKFNLLKEKEFKKFITKTDKKHGWLDEKYIYIPIRKLTKRFYKGKVFNLDVSNDNSFLTESASVHNCWTPWFGALGSKSGFDSLEECYQEQIKHIFALETGLSSDPPMNWRVSSLDKFTLLSSSDAHSPNPWRLGREANAFNLKKITYDEITDAIKKRDSKKFEFTIEVDPNYGKYHYDGCKKCGVSMKPTDSKRLGGICPKCKRKMTIGVLSRVEQLADREEDYTPENPIPFKSLLPLSEVIASAMGIQLFSKKVLEENNKLIFRYGNELKVLLETPFEDLVKTSNEKIAEAIIKIRNGDVKFEPGYDGVYGKPIFSDGIRIKRSFVDQKTLVEF